MIKISKNKHSLPLAVFLFCFQIIASAQNFNPIKLDFGESACDLSGSDNFTIDISFTTKVFNDDNKFIIELSDSDGNFANPATNLRTLVSTPANNYNTSFNINNIVFNLPTGTFGKSYKIRVRTTSPVKEIVSDSFEAYNGMHKESGFGINNDIDFNLCDGESKEISLTISGINGITQYFWYKRPGNGNPDTLIDTTQEPKFTVTNPGVYYVKIDYGKCGYATSRSVRASDVSVAEPKIKGSTPIIICGNTSHTFIADSNNSAYTYQWYKDGELKQSSSSNSYSTPTIGQFGIYHLVVKQGSCEKKSEKVELKNNFPASFNIETVNHGKSILLFCETKELEIKNVPTSATIQWYRNEMPISGASQSKIDVTEDGVYVARVTKPSSSACPEMVDSKEINLLSPKSISVEIKTSNEYKECESTIVKISEANLKVVGTDNNKYELSDLQKSATSPRLLNYKWYKNNIQIPSMLANNIEVNSFANNGDYELEITTCSNNTTLSARSDKIPVKLLNISNITSTSTSNLLCLGDSITYTIDDLIPGYTYEWFKKGETTVLSTNEKDFKVTEVGEYILKQSGFGCDKIIETKKVTLFDSSKLKVIPSEKLELTVGQTVTITASGADSYIWYRGKVAGGSSLSTSEILEVNSIGFYTLVATAGGICSVNKIIEVFNKDKQMMVSNIVTPNQDGINDTWQISDKYAFQPGVLIRIYNSNGKQILKTFNYKNDWPFESLGNQKVFYYKIIKNDILIKAGTISILD